MNKLLDIKRHTTLTVPAGAALSWDAPGRPLSIWLQWNFCWAGTNKPNPVSNIISLEPNLISTPVCFSRQWLSLSLPLPPSIHPCLYVSVTCPPSWRRRVSALAWEAHYPDWRLCFPLWICARVRLCVFTGGECQRDSDLLHQQAFQPGDPLSCERTQTEMG